MLNNLINANCLVRNLYFYADICRCIYLNVDPILRKQIINTRNKIQAETCYMNVRIPLLHTVYTYVMFWFISSAKSMRVFSSFTLYKTCNVRLVPLKRETWTVTPDWPLLLTTTGATAVPRPPAAAFRTSRPSLSFTSVKGSRLDTTIRADTEDVMLRPLPGWRHSFCIELKGKFCKQLREKPPIMSLTFRTLAGQLCQNADSRGVISLLTRLLLTSCEIVKLYLSGSSVYVSNSLYSTVSSDLCSTS